MSAKTQEPSSSRVLRRQLRRAGIEVTATQVERWYKAGLLPVPRRRPLGRGRGSVSSYPPGTVAQVRALLAILERHRNLDKATLLLKLHGYPVSPRALRRAVGRLLLDRAEDLVDRLGQRQYEHPEQVAAQAASALARRRELGTGSRRSPLADAGSDGPARRERTLRPAILPLVGGLDASAWLDTMAELGWLAAARRLASAAPQLATELIEEARTGGLELDRGRAYLEQMTADDFDTLVRFGRVLFAALSAIGLEISTRDPFYADCLAALRRPQRRPPPQSSSPVMEAEAAALSFFAHTRKVSP